MFAYIENKIKRTIIDTYNVMAIYKVYTLNKRKYFQYPQLIRI